MSNLARTAFPPAFQSRLDNEVFSHSVYPAKRQLQSLADIGYIQLPHRFNALAHELWRHDNDQPVHQVQAQ